MTDHPQPAAAGWHVVKGHGTGNDFVVLPDLDGSLALGPGLVRALCDRHTGIGADGVLRVVRSARHPDGERFAAESEFFMDYRNSDGSLAESCGNGVRVFMTYLQRESLVGQSAAVATRGGIVRVRSCADGNISVIMGSPRILADRPVVTAALTAPTGDGSVPHPSQLHPSQSHPSQSHPYRPLTVQAVLAVSVPNPHVVVTVDGSLLDLIDLQAAPAVDPPLPGGQNVEFVSVVARRHVRMRVHERGSGETRSCGTGMCAAVVAMAVAGRAEADGSTWDVDVPGGRCQVIWHLDGDIELVGPAVLVADIALDADWLAGARFAAGE